MKQYFVATLLISILLISSLTSCRSKAEQKSFRNNYYKWQSLFSSINDTALWMGNRYAFFPKKGWKFENGELRLFEGKMSGDLITKKQYSDFELRLEFKMTKTVNSGVKYFVNRMTDKSNNKIGWIGFEYQIIDDYNANEIRGYEGDKGSTGALYLIFPPDPNEKQLNAEGEWNSMRIVVKGTHVEHWLNNKKVMEINIESDEFKKNVAKTKFANYDDFGKIQKGHILLQDHGSEIYFRNIFLLDNSE